MEIVRVVAGFTLGQADILRRAMGKKKPEELARMKAEYLAGTRVQGVADRDAESIFTLLEPFAGYGFNKSHAAAYSVLAYKTAYLKANHPVEFMAANLTNEINSPDAFADYMAEARRMGIEILPPDINLSRKYFSVLGGRIVYGLVGIKNVGGAAVDDVLAGRERDGPYRSFIEFAERIDPRAVNRKVIEMFVLAGLFDSLGGARWTLLANLDRALDFAASRREARLSGQGSLFTDAEDAAFAFEPAEPWTDLERLTREREILGFYFSGHPLDGFRARWQACCTLDLRRAAQASSERVHRLIGMIKGVRTIMTRKGSMMAFAVIEDFNGSVELVLFSDPYEQCRALLVEESIVGVEGTVDTSRDRVQFVVGRIVPPDELPERDSGRLHIRLANGSAGEEELYHLRALLFDRPGGCSVYLHLDSGGTANELVVRASNQLLVNARPEVIEEVKRLPHVQDAWREQGDEWLYSRES